MSGPRMSIPRPLWEPDAIVAVEAVTDDRHVSAAAPSDGGNPAAHERDPGGHVAPEPDRKGPPHTPESKNAGTRLPNPARTVPHHAEGRRPLSSAARSQRTGKDRPPGAPLATPGALAGPGRWKVEVAIARAEVGADAPSAELSAPTDAPTPELTTKAEVGFGPDLLGDVRSRDTDTTPDLTPDLTPDVEAAFEPGAQLDRGVGRVLSDPPGASTRTRPASTQVSSRGPVASPPASEQLAPASIAVRLDRLPTVVGERDGQERRQAAVDTTPEAAELNVESQMAALAHPAEPHTRSAEPTAHVARVAPPGDPRQINQDAGIDVSFLAKAALTRAAEPEAAESQVVPPGQSGASSTEPVDGTESDPLRADEPRPHAAIMPPSRRARIEELSAEREPVKSRRASALDESSSPKRTDGRNAAPSPHPKASPAEQFSPGEMPSAIDDVVDPTPAEWYARLVAVARAEAEARSGPKRVNAPEAGLVNRTMPRPPGTNGPSATGRPDRAPRDQQVILSEGARRFLRPLIGVDPAGVAIFQGARSEQMTAALHADAITTPGAIALGSAYDGETPRGLGLLAHELTHIVRQEAPRFIPPVARTLRGGPAADADEEATATRVEALVVGVAAGRRDDHRVASGERSPTSPPRTEDTTRAGAVEQEAPSFDGWGGLPAPWEPLPAWMPPSGSSVPATRDANPRPAAAVSAPESFTTPASNAPAAPAPIQRADAARVLADEPASAASAPLPREEPPKPVPPDLDALARQVYAVLKRRLEVEVRRERV